MIERGESPTSCGPSHFGPGSMTRFYLTGAPIHHATPFGSITPAFRCPVRAVFGLGVMLVPPGDTAFLSGASLLTAPDLVPIVMRPTRNCSM